MKIQEFLELLAYHQDKSLEFKYSPEKKIQAYHITEIKHLTIDAVNCGIGTDSWKETVIQLWENPADIGKKETMSAYKALSILKKAGRMRPFVPETVLKFEYGNASFPTSQLLVGDYEISRTNLLIKLAVEATDCKDKAACGIVSATKEKEINQCAPESGCC